MSRFWLAGVLLAFILALGWAANHYYDKAVAWRTVAQHAQELNRQQAATITDIQLRQRHVAELDKKYTKEIADAKVRLDALQQCVNSGNCGLRVKATCPKGTAASTTSMDDAAAARLTDAAQRDYFTLRERAEVARRQIAGLQQYIREQCR
nr:lysis protein [Pantoea vagans]